MAATSSAISAQYIVGRRWRGEGLPYEFFDHTGDLGVHLEAATPAGLFESAADALTEALTTAAAVEPRTKDVIALEAASLDLLLLDWLSELIFRFDARQFLVSQTAVRLAVGSPCRLDATVAGEPLDPQRHPVKVLLKAVTYHGLEVKEIGPDRWRGTVIFDI